MLHHRVMCAHGKTYRQRLNVSMAEASPGSLLALLRLSASELLLACFRCPTPCGFTPEWLALAWKRLIVCALLPGYVCAKCSSSIASVGY